MTACRRITEKNTDNLNYWVFSLRKYLNEIPRFHNFDLDIVNFPFPGGDVPRRPSYSVYISQLRLARASSHVNDLKF